MRLLLPILQVALMEIALGAQAIPHMFRLNGSARKTGCRMSRPCDDFRLALVMQTVMFRTSHNLKVFQRIVRCIPVNVMHYFVRAESSAQIFLGNLTMESRLPFARVPHTNVPGWLNGRTAFPQRAIRARFGACAARIRTETATARPYGRWPPVERCAAILTCTFQFAWGFPAMMGTHRMVLSSGATLRAVPAAPGLPVAPIISQNQCTYHQFSVFEWHPDRGRVLLRRLGAEELERAA